MIGTYKMQKQEKDYSLFLLSESPFVARYEKMYYLERVRALL
jgi:hypothetical protein